jgi:hypothetical protein
MVSSMSHFSERLADFLAIPTIRWAYQIPNLISSEYSDDTDGMTTISIFFYLFMKMLPGSSILFFYCAGIRRKQTEFILFLLLLVAHWRMSIQFWARFKGSTNEAFLLHYFNIK